MSVVRSPRAKMVYAEELDALVQEDILSDLTLCSSKECEPPYGGKEACEYYQNGACKANISRAAVDEIVELFCTWCIQHGLDPSKDDVRKWIEDKLWCAGTTITEEV